MTDFFERLEGLPLEKRLYLLQTLANHLHEAGQEKRRKQLLTNFGYMNAKLAAFGIYLLIEDYQVASRNPPDSLHLIQGALRLASHILASEPKQLASQLHGRLLTIENDDVQNLLQQFEDAQTGPWLRLYSNSLTPPGGPLVHTFSGHTDRVSSIAWSVNGVTAISGSVDQTVRVWDTQHGIELYSLLGHTAKVNAVAINQEGEIAISGSSDHTVRVWNALAGTELLLLLGHTASVHAVALSPDGHIAISGSADNTVKVWDLQKGVELYTFEHHTGEVYAVAVSSDGQYAFSAGSDHVVRVWYLENGTEECVLTGHEDTIISLAVNKNGDRVITSGTRGSLKLWDVKKQVELMDLPRRTFSMTTFMMFNQAISDRSVDGMAEAYQETLRRFGIRALALRPDGQWVIHSEEDKIVLVDLEQMNELGILTGHSQAVTALALTLDGQYALSGSEDHTVKLWDLDKIPKMRTVQSHTRDIRSIASTPDGRIALSTSADAKIWGWNVRRGSKLNINFMAGSLNADDPNSITFETIKSTYQAPLWAVAITADGRRAVSASIDHNVQLWDVEKGRRLRLLSGHKGEVRSVAITPDGSRAISGGQDNKIIIWELHGTLFGHTLTGHEAPVTALAISKDGRFAVSGSEDCTLKIWDIARRIELKTLKGHTGAVEAVAITSNGDLAISASADHTLKLWDLEKGIELRTLAGHTDIVWSVAIATDGSCAVSASEDETVRLWDLVSGSVITQFVGDGAFRACAIVGHGETIIAGSASGNMYFLELIGGDLSGGQSDDVSLSDFSFSTTFYFDCPLCKRHFGSDIWLIIDATQQPDLILKVIEGTLNTITCPKCGFEGQADNGSFIIFFPHGAPSSSSVKRLTCVMENQDGLLETLNQMINHLANLRGNFWMKKFLDGENAFANRDTLPQILTALLSPSTQPDEGSDSYEGLFQRLKRTVQRILEQINPSPAEKIRRRIVTHLYELKQKNQARIHDPFYRDMLTGYNMAAWADQGYKDALAILEFTLPTPNETTENYARRIYTILLKKKDVYYNDEADEGGGATGALQDAISSLTEIAKNKFDVHFE